MPSKGDTSLERFGQLAFWPSFLLTRALANIGASFALTLLKNNSVGNFYEKLPDQA